MFLFSYPYIPYVISILNNIVIVFIGFTNVSVHADTVSQSYLSKYYTVIS